MATEEQILKQLEAMAKGFGQLNQTMTAMARASGARVDGRTALPGEVEGRAGRGGVMRSDKKAEKAAENYDTASKEFLRTAKGLKGIRTSFSKWNDVLSKTSGYLAGADADFRSFGNNIFTIGQHAKKIVEGMGRYSTALAKSAKAQSMLYANQLKQLTQMEDYEQAGALEKLTDALENLTEGQKRALGVLDETTGKLRTDLNFEELAQKRAALGDVLGDVAENLKGTDFKNLKEMAAMDPASLFGAGGLEGGERANANREAIVKIAAQLEKANLIQPGTVLDKDGNIAKDALVKTFQSNKIGPFIKDLADALDRLEQSASKTDKALDALATPIGKLTTALQTAEGRLGLFNKGMAYFLTTAALKKGADGLKRLYEEVTSFNVAQIPATYTETYKSAVQLGMGFKEASLVLQENKRILAIYGPKEFRSAMAGMKDTFASFGYNMSQAAELIGPAVESAITSGINISDSSALNKFMKDTMSSFQNISGVVNITAKEYMQLNGQLLKADGTFETLMGMDTSRRQAYAQELIQLRDRYAVQGLELQQAQKLVELQQQQQRDKISSKFGEAAKLLMQMQLNGLGGQQSMEAYRLATKGIRTREEDSRLTQLLGANAQATEARRVGSYGRSEASGIISDVQAEALGLSGPLAEMQRKSLEMRSAQQAGADATGVAGRASALAKGNESLAQFGNVINSISTVMQSALLAAVTGTTISFIALYKQSRMLSGAFGMMGKASGLSSSLPSGAPGGKAGGKLGKFGKAGGGGLLGLGLTLGAGMAGDALTGAGMSTSGAALDALGTAGGWALTGASIGSVIPGLGTGVGAAIGGAAGLAKGVYDNWDTFATPSGDTIKLPKMDQNDDPGGINKAGSGVVAVKDADTAAQLAAIATLTNQMIQILTKISEKEGLPPPQIVTQTASQTAPATVPQAYTFTTGRAARS